MRNTLIGLAIGLAALISIPSCSSTDPSDEPRLIMQTEVSSNTVTAGEKSGTIQAPGDVDSIRVHRARVLVSRIKLHTADDGVDDNKGKDVKIGPAVIDFTKDKVSTVFSTAIPVGRYEKIKLEMHKFSNSEASTYALDGTFGPFAAPERLTLIVNGTMYINGVAEDFTWTDDRTSNLWVKFEPFIEVTASSTTSVVMNFNPAVAFRSGGKLLDPKKSLDPDKSDIKDLLRAQMWTALFLRRK